MFKKIAASLAALTIAAVGFFALQPDKIPPIALKIAHAATCTVPYAFQDFDPASGVPQPIEAGKINGNFNAVVACINGGVTPPNPANVLIHVATNSALKALPTLLNTTSTVIARDGFNSAGDGGAGVYYWSTSNCSISNGDNGSQVQPSVGTGCWLLFPNTITRPRMFGALGNALYGNGIATTGNITTFTGQAFSASYIGQTAIVSGVGLNGNPLVTTLNGSTSVSAAPSITQSPGSPSYYLSTYVLTAAGSGFSVNDVLTLPAPSAGSATIAAQLTVDTVNGSGNIQTAHVTKAGSYTNAQPYGTFPTINLTGGTCSVAATIAPSIDQAGEYVVGNDDTAAITAWTNALFQYPVARADRVGGSSYMVRSPNGVPSGNSTDHVHDPHREQYRYRFDRL